MNEIWIDKIVGDNSGVELQTEFHEFLSHLTLTVYAWIFRFNAVGSKVSVVWYCTDGFLYPNVVLKLFLVWWIAWAVICLWTLSYWFSWWPPKDTERSQVLQNIRVFLYSQCERFCPFGIISCLLSWGEKKETSLHLNIKKDQRGVPLLNDPKCIWCSISYYALYQCSASQGTDQGATASCGDLVISG